MDFKENKKKYKKQYYEAIRPIMQVLEEKRKDYLRKYILVLIVFFLFHVLLLVAFLILTNNGIFSNYISNVPAVIIISMLIIFSFLSCYFEFVFKNNLKKTCTPEILKALETSAKNNNKSLSFSSKENKISDETLKLCGLFDCFNKHHDDDIFSGCYQGIYFHINESTIEPNGFKGLLINFYINKKVNSQTIIRTQKDKRRNEFYNKTLFWALISIFIVFQVISITSQDIHFDKAITIPWTILNISIFLLIIVLFLSHSVKMKKAKFEDIDFEKLFEVHTEDQIDARYLITTSFMERLKNLYNAFGRKNILCSFYKNGCINNLMIAIQSKKDLFELGNLYHNITTKENQDKFLEEITSIFMMIDYFKLDEDTKL